MPATFPAVQCKRDTGKGKNCLQDDAEQGERGIRKLLKKAYTQKNRGLLGENNAKQQHNQVNTKIHGVFAGNVFLYTNPWCF
jgi:hypothetical protein